ncbi:hypothetical protein ACFOY4_01375 [Actinomadura syzygii]|uniref:Uncharacterized protein n=1 Tax=Actinomadura syzygii TaxID=1427538 RepID=A0A5D0TT31_9ACTN|nr:hypothetical protein [Actinomadura syzygii]TYC08600.1 hypothetical protein FXF65_37540 [Actinomadura syzygii]
MTKVRSAEFVADARAGTIMLHLDGEPAPMLGQPDVRGVRNRKLREAILAALDQAMKDGARYGKIDNHRECAASLSNQPLPGRFYYASGRHDGGWTVTRRESHRDPEVILTGGKPYYTQGDVVNALDRAFKIGGAFGHPAVDRIARPLHIRATGATLTAIEVSRHRPLRHYPQRACIRAHTAFGAQILARVSVAGEPDVFVYFRRFDGGCYDTDSRPADPPNPHARWEQASQELSADALMTCDLNTPTTPPTTPNTLLAAWLDTVVDLAPSPPPRRERVNTDPDDKTRDQDGGTEPP